MHNLDLILTLTAGLAAAVAFGYLTHRLGLSPIVGYLLAGIAVGPHTPGFVADPRLATLLARSLGWGWSTGLVFGLALSVASTVVLTRVLADHRALHTRAGHVAVGWLVVEDLYTVLVLVLLPVVLGPHAGAGGAG